VGDPSLPFPGDRFDGDGDNARLGDHALREGPVGFLGVLCHHAGKRFPSVGRLIDKLGLAESDDALEPHAPTTRLFTLDEFPWKRELDAHPGVLLQDIDLPSRSRTVDEDAFPIVPEVQWHDIGGTIVAHGHVADRASPDDVVDGGSVRDLFVGSAHMSVSWASVCHTNGLPSRTSLPSSATQQYALFCGNGNGCFVGLHHPDRRCGNLRMACKRALGVKGVKASRTTADRNTARQSFC